MEKFLRKKRENIYSNGHYLETNKEEQPFLRATLRLCLIHIPIKFREDIPNAYRYIEDLYSGYCVMVRTFFLQY